MPSGKVHAKHSTLLAPVVGLTFVVADGVLPGLAAGFGCMSGIVLSPDLDIDTWTESEKAVIRESRPLGWLFFSLFYPYARILSHRSPWSHWPVVGTLGRLGYLVLVLSPLAYVLWLILGKPDATLPSQVQHVLFCWGTGLSVSDTAHWIADVVWSSKAGRVARRILG